MNRYFVLYYKGRNRWTREEVSETEYYRIRAKRIAAA